MDNLKHLFLPALLGLTAGMAHGVIAHHADLPMSLTEQLVKPFAPAQVMSQSWEN